MSEPQPERTVLVVADADNKGRPIPLLTQAASIALALMKQARRTSFSADLVPASNVAITDEHWELLNAFADDLAVLAWTDDFRKHVTVAQCSVCGNYGVFASGGSVPRGCFVQAQCPGELLPKAKPAKATPAPEMSGDNDGPAHT